MSYKLANGMKMWKQNGNITKLLFSLNGLKIEIDGNDSLSIKHKENILVHIVSPYVHEPANKQHTFPIQISRLPPSPTLSERNTLLTLGRPRSAIISYLKDFNDNI